VGPNQIRTRRSLGFLPPQVIFSVLIKKKLSSLFILFPRSRRRRARRRPRDTTPSRAANHEGCCAVAEAEVTYAPRAQPALLLLPLRGSRCARGWFSLRRYWRGSATGSSVSAAARAPGHHAGGVGSPSPPGAVPCEGALRGMPDYIRNLH